MDITRTEEWAKAQRGELYWAFSDEFIAVRDRCAIACHKFNTTDDTSRRNLAQLWRSITCDERPFPPPAATQAEDNAQLRSEPWMVPPVHIDYGFNVKVEAGSMVNFNATFIDTCPITIGARTLVGPNCSFYSGTHPLDPLVRNGFEGPELGKPITIGEDCWLGGNVTILPGVTVGRGCTVGAGSVVTKDVPPFHVVAGNPARILRKIETKMDPSQNNNTEATDPDHKEGAEVPMSNTS